MVTEISEERIAGVQNALFEELSIENVGLAASFSVNPSSCGNSDFYKEYLLFNAISDQNSGRNTTHLFIDKDANRIMGFVSLRASSLLKQKDGGKYLGDPALEVSVLAVDQEYERRGVGSALIDFVLSEVVELHEHFLGIQYVILAADEKAIGFYKKMGFSSFADYWEGIPKDNWSLECDPMFMELDFESGSVQVFYDELDDEE